MNLFFIRYFNNSINYYAFVNVVNFISTFYFTSSSINFFLIFVILFFYICLYFWEFDTCYTNKHDYIKPNFSTWYSPCPFPMPSLHNVISIFVFDDLFSPVNAPCVHCWLSGLVLYKPHPDNYNCCKLMIVLAKSCSGGSISQNSYSSYGSYIISVSPFTVFSVPLWLWD